MPLLARARVTVPNETHQLVDDVGVGVHVHRGRRRAPFLVFFAGQLFASASAQGSGMVLVGDDSGDDTPGRWSSWSSSHASVSCPSVCTLAEPDSARAVKYRPARARLARRGQGRPALLGLPGAIHTALIGIAPKVLTRWDSLYALGRPAVPSM
jgi:hypothetical protein